LFVKVGFILRSRLIYKEYITVRTGCFRIGNRNTLKFVLSTINCPAQCLDIDNLFEPRSAPDVKDGALKLNIWRLEGNSC